MSVEVLKAGLLTTVQDLGRFGCAMLGVGRAGVMDDAAMRIANALVGNAIDAPVLELTLVGPRLRFDAAATIAIAGAEFSAHIGDREIDAWRPIDIEAGEEIEIGHARRGLRAWLAICGGIVVEPTLGSASTDVNAGLLGYCSPQAPVAQWIAQRPSNPWVAGSSPAGGAQTSHHAGSSRRRPTGSA